MKSLAKFIGYMYTVMDNARQNDMVPNITLFKGKDFRSAIDKNIVYEYVRPEWKKLMKHPLPSDSMINKTMGKKLLKCI